MLFTRCPQCDTVFRITDEALRKAGGQVRCGRCARIFNAHQQLRDDEDRAEQAGAAEHSAEDATARDLEPMPEPAAERIAEPGTAESSSEPDITADQVEAILDDAIAEPEWMRDPDEPRQTFGDPRLWSRAATALAVLLLIQTLHHFRAPLAAQPVIGPVMQQTYSMLGMPLSPRLSSESYAVLSSSAVAQSDPNGRSSLIIRSRIQNASARELPYPFVQLRLLDRWEKTIGSRVFSPNEYLVTAATEPTLAARAVVDAEIVIFDPGPDASGFEIDVCVEMERSFSCSGDAVFD